MIFTRQKSHHEHSHDRQKLHEYISTADDKKVKAIYTIIESDLNEMYEWWNDKELIAELDLRSDDLKSGKDKGYMIN